MSHQVSEKIKIWRKPNGRFWVTKFIVSEKRRNETEDEFIARMTALEKQMHPELLTLQEIDSTKTELRNAILSTPDKSRRKMNISANGQFLHDPNFKLAHEIRQERVNLIRQKLMSGTPLTQEEAEYIVR